MQTEETQIHFNETRQKILEAAMRCVKQWGIDKTNLNDIAKEAGVTRPTVYSYFPNKTDVIRSALLQSGYNLGERMLTHMNKFERTEDRLIESVLFALEELPKEPFLAVITQAGLSAYINEDALSDREGAAIRLLLFKEIYKNTPVEEAELREITELASRLTLSLLMIKGPEERNRKQQREFLQRRLIPSAGLSPGPGSCKTAGDSNFQV